MGTIKYFHPHFKHNILMHKTALRDLIIFSSDKTKIESVQMTYVGRKMKFYSALINQNNIFDDIFRNNSLKS